MRRFVGAVACVAAAVGFTAGPAMAQDPTVIQIPLDTVVRGAPESEHLLATVPVAAADQGKECEVVAESVNNSSTHPNTDLIVRSGGGEVVVPDVERAPNVTTEADGTLTLGD